jgi:hypothetical protein
MACFFANGEFMRHERINLALGETMPVKTTIATHDVSCFLEGD